VTDTVSKEKRSEIMSRIQGGIARNRMERIVHNWLKAKHIKHTMNPKLEGSPDILLKDSGICVFIDGCFWHRCPLHYRRPKSNAEFWRRHIEETDARREEKRQKLPYGWVRIWEHDVKSGMYKRVLEPVTAKKRSGGFSKHIKKQTRAKTVNKEGG